MKALKCLVIVGLLVLFLIGYAEAIPMNYTFNGTIGDAFLLGDFDSRTDADIEWRNTIQNQPINFTYSLDTDNWRTSEVKLINYSNNFFIQPPPPGEVINYRIPETDGGGLIYTSTDYNNNTVQFGKPEGPYGGPVSGGTDFNWQLGTNLGGYSQGYSSPTRQEVFRIFEYRVWLTNIQPVPEPSTMLLLGSGIVGLWGFRRKFKK